MSKILLALAVLLASSAMFAQSSPIRVNVAGSASASSQAVAKQIAGKLGSTARYGLVTTSKLDILLEINCLPLVVGGHDAGVACSSEITYWPVAGIVLSQDIAGSMSAGGESDVATDLFDSFVRKTSDDKLEAARNNFKTYFNAAVAKFPQGLE
ncbi:MAG: hypothetical protein WCC97_11935 [Candidatus Acidiferrales bacterium]